ncbi:MAG TPA: hypothetical protein VK541_05020 [Pedobacter sp.]|uniref:hypothetical protein n=1 Tax=Pedobacter sp. TaxID=1411316 RepID=UPI002BB2EF79|nr:hypothetical protein [Pedobacter sp.]HMI01821.1 hypothetical protein [Pedobacter sp.]
MKIYSNPERNEIELQKLMQQAHREQIQREAIQIRNGILKAAVLVAVFIGLFYVWSILGN